MKNQEGIPSACLLDFLPSCLLSRRLTCMDTILLSDTSLSLALRDSGRGLDRGKKAIEAAVPVRSSQAGCISPLNIFISLSTLNFLSFQSQSSCLAQASGGNSLAVTTPGLQSPPLLSPPSCHELSAQWILLKYLYFEQALYVCLKLWLIQSRYCIVQNSRYWSKVTLSLNSNKLKWNNIRI